MNLLNLKWCKNHEVALLNDKPPFLVGGANNNEFLLQKLQWELNGPVIFTPKTFAEIRLLWASENDLENSILDKKNSWESEPIINLVDSLLEEAIQANATDIHLEPNKNFRVRFRTDGMLNDYKTLPFWVADPILIRLKILAEIDITDRRIPHDGSFTFTGIKGNINIRVSTLPIQNGEKCVLRLLPLESKENLGLQSLKLGEKSTAFLKKVFNSPQGIFLVTGPTGSGKTTTLHQGLLEILHKKINVTTLEDPVEYFLEGANQVQVNEKCGFTFATALRAILRQDPDVILVGEIRDAETAQIAIRAAQTGHLVLSTLHTNSAKAAFSRLEDLGIPKKILEDSLLGIMAQRLVRIKYGEIYKGRQAIVEILKPDGTFVEGSLKENAEIFLQNKITDKFEIERVLGI